MPIYEYRCSSCGKVTEKIQRFSDPPLAACPECGEKVEKVISAPAIQFKGTGWYVTDYADKKKGSSGGDSTEGSTDSDTSTSSDTSSSTSKKTESTKKESSSTSKKDD